MTRIVHLCVGLMTILAVAACAASGPGRAPVASAPTVEVSPALETEVVASTNVDAADDPAIWSASPGDAVMLNGPTAGFIAGTDKKAGLYIFGLDGRTRQFLPEGLLNNVDLRGGIGIAGRPQVVIGASDRGRFGVALYLFDPGSADPSNAIRFWGMIKSDVTEPYGFCMGRLGTELHAILIGKDGQVRQYRIEDGGQGPVGTEVRRFAVGSQSEGCVVDDEGGALYVGEELKGLWRYGLRPSEGAGRDLIQAVDSSGRLVADVEGATLMRDRTGTYLIVSSQGDSAFALWRVSAGAPAYVGRFRVVAANGIDAVTGTDGIDAISGAVGTFPSGFLVIQDDENEGMTQNFKIVDWRTVQSALKLR